MVLSKDISTIITSTGPYIMLDDASITNISFEFLLNSFYLGLVVRKPHFFTHVTN